MAFSGSFLKHWWHYPLFAFAVAFLAVPLMIYALLRHWASILFERIKQRG